MIQLLKGIGHELKRGILSIRSATGKLNFVGCDFDLVMSQKLVFCSDWRFSWYNTKQGNSAKIRPTSTRAWARFLHQSWSHSF